ncbi:MAG: AraC family transcriptional regulator [Psychrosphaera sp.]|nr:AraC family transcriptional regulator [Psychrosphaera sp.]
MTIAKQQRNTIADSSMPRVMIEQVGVQQIITMFDLLPDTLFWIKDANSRMVHVNNPLRTHLGLDNSANVIGMTDFDFAPKHIAKQFVTDDKKVMKGMMISNRLEINIANGGEFAWYITSKRPLFDDDQTIIGTYGVSRQLAQTDAVLSAMAAIKAPVDYINKNYMDDFSIADLAKTAHLSVSALERRFKKYMNKTPRQFIIEVRLENARRLLVETSLPIALVGSESGFADHSYFSRKFAQMFDDIPSVFRKNHLKHQQLG